jgi:hypothetical protein
MEDIDPACWDALVRPGDYQASHRFIRVCEHARIGSARFRHVMLFERCRPVAIASLFFMKVELQLLAEGMPRRILDALQRIGPETTRIPVVFCGLPISLGGSCLRIAEGTDVLAVMQRISRAMTDFARESGTGFVCFKELDQGEQERLGPYLSRLGFFTAPSLPGCRLDLDWPDWQAYLHAMRAGYRQQVHQDTKAMARSGLRFEHGQGLQLDTATVHRLYGQVMARAPNRLEVLPEVFFQLLAQEFQGSLHSIVGRLEGEPIAIAILLWQPPVCHFLLVGLDYAHLESTHVYPNLVAEVLRRAQTLGATQVELGQTSYALKGRLGGLTTPRHFWLKHLGGVQHALLARASPWLFPPALVRARRVFKTP